MSEENKNENLRPSKMRGVAFPKAKYGVILAITIIVIVNLIIYKDKILNLLRSNLDLGLYNVDQKRLLVNQT